MVKLRAGQIRQYRLEQLALQNGNCALCGQPCAPQEAVLDHDHVSGQIRGVLHRFCNTFLGKIENGVRRNRIQKNQLSVILERYQVYVADLQDLLHPTHRTPEQRLQARRLRARKKRQ